MSIKPKSAPIPDDPDPTPIASANSSTNNRTASREEKKRVSSSYGRSKTILAGTADPNEKKSILGG